MINFDESVQVYTMCDGCKNVDWTVDGYCKKCDAIILENLAKATDLEKS